MNKRVLSSVLALALIFGSAAAIPKTALPHSACITAAAETSGDYDYKILSDGTAQITKYNGSCENLFIPSALDDKKVTSIGKLAFYNRSQIKSITLPRTLTSIGESAFYGCSSLLEINIPSSVTSIERASFADCTRLESVTLPENITTLEDATFFNCKMLTSISIPNSVTSLGSNLFYNCKNLAKVSIPTAVTRIGNEAFNGSKWLVDRQDEDPLVVVNSILIDAKKCSGDVNVNKDVKVIGEGAFENNRNVKSVTLPYGITMIDNRAFYLSQISQINLPDTLVRIGDNAFLDCTKLKGMTIPRSVEKIGNEAVGFYRKTDPTQEEIYCEKIRGFKITCFSGSAAETYARMYGFDYDYVLPPVVRLAGSSRYDTAADISKATYDKADTVVLAYSMNYADALAGVPLAAKLKAPILLTNTDSLDPATLAEIKRLGAKEVLILGGENAISKQVEQELEKDSIAAQRIAGATRFGTASQIAQKLNTKPTDVFFVYGFNYADALSVSTAAAQKNAPVIYLTTNGELNADTAAYLAELKEYNCVKNAYVIGGDKVISDDMMNKAAAALGLSKATRIAGADRFETCVEVNKTFKAFLTGNKLCIATGMDFPDALAGGVYAAKNRSPLFLVNGKAKTPALNDAQKAYLKSVKIDSYAVFGGTGAVPDKHIESIVRNK